MSIYKFTLDQDFIFDLSPFTLIPHSINKPWMKIDGYSLIIPAGYSWDGCSPKFKIGNQILGTPDFGDKTKYASLVHDALYQYAGVHLINKDSVDYIFYKMMNDNNFKGAKFYYLMVKKFGSYFWDKYYKQHTSFAYRKHLE